MGKLVHHYLAGFQQYAMIIRSHRASFHKAKKAIADPYGMERVLSVSAAQKFAELDRDVGELRQLLQQQDRGSKVVVDQLAAESKASAEFYVAATTQAKKEAAVADAQLLNAQLAGIEKLKALGGEIPQGKVQEKLDALLALVMGP